MHALNNLVNGWGCFIKEGSHGRDRKMDSGLAKHRICSSKMYRLKPDFKHGAIGMWDLWEMI